MVGTVLGKACYEIYLVSFFFLFYSSMDGKGGITA